MHRFIKLCLIFSLSLQVTAGWSMPHRKIQYTVEIKNTCKNQIKNITIQNDGKNIFPAGNSRGLGDRTSASYDMPMIIPDIAAVDWTDAAGRRYQARIPLHSLIPWRDYFGHEFRIEYRFCDDQLHVIFGKKTGRFEYDRKEIWSNQKKDTALSGNES